MVSGVSPSGQVRQTGKIGQSGTIDRQTRVRPTGKIGLQRQAQRFRARTRGTTIAQQSGAEALPQDIRPSIVPLTDEQKKALADKQIAELQKKEQEAIDKKLTDFDKKIADVREELNRLEKVEETESVARRKDFLTGFLAMQGTARSFIQKGGSVNEAVSFLEAQGGAKLSRVAARREAGISSIRPSKEVTAQAVTRQFKEGKISQAEFEKRFEQVTGELPLITRTETKPQVELAPVIQKDVISPTPTTTPFEGSILQRDIQRTAERREAERLIDQPKIIIEPKDVTIKPPTTSTITDFRRDIKPERREELAEVRSAELTTPQAFAQTGKNILGFTIAGFKEEGPVGGFVGGFEAIKNIPETFARVESKTGVGMLTEKQIEILKEQDIGTPSVPVEVIRAYEPGISRPELVLATRKEIAKGEDPLVAEVFLTQSGLRGDVLSKNISADIAPAFQEKIASGELTQEKAQEQFQEEFNKRFTEVAKEVGRLDRESSKKTGRTIIRAKSRELGEGLVAVPETIALGAGSPALITGLGVAKFAGGVATDSQEDVLGGATLIGLGGLGKLKGLEKSIVTDELKDLSKQDLKILELRVPTGDKKELAIIKARRQFLGLTEDVDLTGKFVRSKGGKFVFKGTEGIAKTSGELSFNVLGGAQTTKVASIRQFDLALAGRGIPIGKGRAVSVSESVFIPRGEQGLFFQGDLAKTTRGLDLVTGRIIRKDDITNFENLLKSTRVSTGKEAVRQRSLGLSQRIDEGLFATRGGKIDEAIINVETRGLQPEFNIGLAGEFESVGVTRRISPKELLKLSNKFTTFQAGQGTPRPGKDLIKRGLQSITSSTTSTTSSLASSEGAVFGTTIKGGLGPVTLAKTSEEVASVVGITNIPRANLQPRSSKSIFVPQQTLPQLEQPIKQKQLSPIAISKTTPMPQATQQRGRQTALTRQATIQLPALAQPQRSLQRQASIQLQAPLQAQLQRQTAFGFPGTPTQPSIGFPIGLGIIPPFAFKPSRDGGRRRESLGPRPRRPFEIQRKASLVALAKDIRSPFRASAEFSGLVIRPKLIKKKTKKKKKKTKKKSKKQKVNKGIFSLR